MRYAGFISVVQILIGSSGVLAAEPSSNALSDSAKICSRALDLRKEIENYFHMPCDRLLLKDLLKIRKLDVVFNQPTQLKARDFSGLDNLEELMVEGNVTAIDAGAFSSLKNLIQLDLHQVQLNELKTEQFRGLDRLTALNISTFPRWRPGEDEGTPEYTVLASNAKMIIRSGAFKGLPTQVNLTFETGKTTEEGHWLGAITLVGRLEAGAFEGLSSKEDLDLYDVFVKSASVDAFRGLDSVWELTLATTFNNGVLKEGALRSLPALESLKISENHDFSELSIEKKAFADVHVRNFTLYLNNAEQILDLMPVQGLEEVESIKLAGHNGRVHLNSAYSLPDDFYLHFPNLRSALYLNPRQAAHLASKGMNCQDVQTPNDIRAISCVR